MDKHQISENHYFTTAKDRTGGTIRTDVYKLENMTFEAFSTYWKDEQEEIVGFAQSDNDEDAINLSRDALKKEWKAEQERIATTRPLT